MSVVGVLTDTTASIPPALARELQIEMISYYVHRGVDTLRDLVDVQPEPFARYLAQTDRLPTTSNPSIGDYLTGCKRLAERTRQIVALTMTSKGSGAYHACKAAPEVLRERAPDVRVEVIDSLRVAMSQGWAAIEAARSALEGRPLNEVTARAREVAQKTTMIMTADAVYVMSKSPGRMVVRREVDLPRPRDPEITYTSEFTDIVHELRGHIGAVRNVLPKSAAAASAAGGASA